MSPGSRFGFPNPAGTQERLLLASWPTSSRGEGSLAAGDVGNQTPMTLGNRRSRRPQTRVEGRLHFADIGIAIRLVTAVEDPETAVNESPAWWSPEVRRGCGGRGRGWCRW